MTTAGVSANRLEIMQIADAVAREKSIEKEIVIAAMEHAMQKAARSRYGAEHDIRAKIDPKTGEMTLVRAMTIVDESTLDDEIRPFNPSTDLLLKDALKTDPDAVIGKVYEELLPPMEFGRVAAQTAKQVINHEVREAERERQYEEYKDRVGEVLNGIVKRVEYGNTIVDLGRAEGIIRRDEMIPRENVRPGDRLRGYLFEVRAEARGPQLFVSRTAPEFMMELFKLEVPEVGQGLVTIMGAARDPGDRAKIAVKANDNRTDPIGACIGMRGSRVQAVSNELNGERVDIVLWNDNPAQFVINAMAPAQVESIIVDEEKHSMDIAVAETELSKAIGRGGQNVRLASKLTGWQLNVMTQADVTAKSEAEQEAARQLFQDKLEVDAEIASILVQEGFSSIEEIAYVPESELLSVEEFEEDVVAELRARARDALLTQMIVAEEVLDENKPSDELVTLEGMDEETAYTLAERGVRSLEDLADLAVDDIIDIEGMDETRAAQLIMAARAPLIAKLEQGA